jgi:uncharacterized protein (TIGR03437 family)
LIRTHKCVALLTAVLAAVAVAQVETPPVPPLVSVQGDAGRLTAPGSSFTLSVQVRNKAGVPQAGSTVVFIAPTSGASGTFTSGTARVSQVKVVTDSGGIASAAFQTNEQRGVFLVRAEVDRTDGAATFAISNGSPVPAPALSAAAARSEVRSRILSNAAEDENLRLHGPFYLPSGSRILAPFPSPAQVRNQPVVTDKASWLFWIDDNPMAGFAHPVRWVLLDAADTSGQAAARARVLRQFWWPHVVLPGSNEVHSLAPPVAQVTDTGATAGIEQLLRAFFGGRTFADPPPDACAILLHGPNLSGAPQDPVTYRDFLLRNMLVPPGNIFLNTSIPGNPVHQPVTKADLQRIIEAARAKNCRKIYFMISTHGAEATQGAGLCLQPDPSNPTGFVSYENLMEMLSPLRGAELCVIVQACFSGQIIPWLQGRGFTGQVITNADADSVSWFWNGFGAAFGFYLRQAWQTPAADTNGDGTVSLIEARTFALGYSNIANVATVSKPQGATINATGTREATGGVFYARKPGTYMLMVRRPQAVSLNTPLPVTVTTNDAVLADFGRASTTVVLPPGVDALPVTLEAFEMGETTFRFESTDPTTGQAYRGTGHIQIGDYTLNPDPLRLLVGETGVTRINRYGYLIRLAKMVSTGFSAATTLQISSLNPDIAVPTSATVSLGYAQEMGDIPIRALKAGVARIRVEDPLTGTICYFDVYVDAPQTSQTTCPTAGTFLVQFPVLMDPRGHFPFIGLSNGSVIWSRTGSTFTITGDRPQIVNMSGPVDPTNCTFNGSAISPNPIAGFSNVQAEILDGSFGPLPGADSGAEPGNRAPFDAIRYTYRLGGNGALPGGDPITYSATGTPSCTFTVAPATQAIPAIGGSGTANVTAAASCAWTAVANVPWITVVSGARASGNGTVTYTVASNTTAANRSGTLTIATRTLTVTQTGAPATQPLISRVLNGGNFQTGLTPSAWMSLLGTNLATTTRLWAQGDFSGNNLPTQLDGVSVRINGRLGYPSYISPTQINVLAPDDPAEGELAVQVTAPGGTSNTVLVQKQTYAPALFQFDAQNRRYAAVVHADGALAGKPELYPGITRPVKSGDIVLLFATGFGPTAPDTPSNLLVTQAAATAKPIVVRIGGLNAEVQFAGKVGAGLYQFNVVAPRLPDGDHEILVSIEGQTTIAGVYLTIKN